MKPFRLFVLCALFFAHRVVNGQDALRPMDLRCEYHTEPLAVEASSPRLSWRVDGGSVPARGARQSARQIRVATSPEVLQSEHPDLWDSGKVLDGNTMNIPYSGKELESGQPCFWMVKIWDQDGRESPWSPPAYWSMGFLHENDWTAQWITHADRSPIHSSREELELPPARHFRKDFKAHKKVRRAIAYASALGNYRLYLNGHEVSDGYLLPGWSDYRQRAYYQAFDVTKSLVAGENCVGAIVTEGWYAGYVGYGLLVGYGPNKSGKNFYGKTPSLLVQIEIEYTDGSRDTVATDSTWQVTSDGPIREADIIMGESFDARNVDLLWCAPPQAFLELSRVRDIWSWSPAIESSQNGSAKAVYSDTLGNREVDLGFHRPPVMQSHSGIPVRVVQELPTRKIMNPQPGVYIFDLGQNFAGVVRLKTRGANGQKIQLRYGEMLHPDGRLMTENLRKARATDYYVCAGTGDREEWLPQFTYHGFQYVEVTGLGEQPEMDTVTGLVLTSDTKYDSTFACSDDVMTKFWQNGRWTQMANLIEIPTDCPQRDERLGWMGDAQAYIRTASYNADVAAFFTKWLDDVREAQRESGAYPDYAPYPMAHGLPGATHGAAWTDAGIICPWTIWKVYGDTRVLQRQWPSMCRFMDWRASADPELRGVKLGNTWGDWLNVNEETPIEYIDLCYHAYDCQLMEQMADAIDKKDFAETYRHRLSALRANFRDQYVRNDGTLKIETQTAHVLALSCGMFVDMREITLTANRLAARIDANETRMATGFLGTKSLLPALTSAGQHDLACRLFQSRRFPSWGYEVSNGATSVWERWDSYTQDFGFDGVAGKNNAAMNSFSHYAFGAVMEWVYRDLAGIDSDGPGYQKIIFRPGIPSVGNRNVDPQVPTLHWAKARYAHLRGAIVSEWSRTDGLLTIEVALPPNTTGTVYLPKGKGMSIQEGGKALTKAPGVTVISADEELVIAEVVSGTYRFEAR